MENNNEIIKNAVNIINDKWKNAINEVIHTLMCLGGCGKIDTIDPKQIQIELLNNNHDIIRYEFENEPFKTVICLTDIKGKFEKGYELKMDIEDDFKITRTKINGKVQFEKTIKNIQ